MRDVGRFVDDEPRVPCEPVSPHNPFLNELGHLCLSREVSAREGRYRHRLGLYTVRLAVGYELRRFERARGATVEPGAERALAGALFRFLFRPRRCWRLQPEAHWAQGRRYLLGLPERLERLWVAYGRPASLPARAVKGWLRQLAQRFVYEGPD